MAAGKSDQAIADLLGTIPLFREIGDGELQALAGSARVLTRSKGGRIFEEGSHADSCYVLVSGLAKVMISSRRGTTITLDVVGERELVGELGLLDRAPRSASLVAAHDCRLIQISRGAFIRLRRNPAFEDRLVAHVTAMLRRATEQLRAIHTFSSAEHVQWCLGRLALRLGRRTGRMFIISPRPHHQDIADMTGCTRETVTRVMRRLKATNTVSWNATSLMLDERGFKDLLVP